MVPVNGCTDTNMATAAAASNATKATTCTRAFACDDRPHCINTFLTYNWHPSRLGTNKRRRAMEMMIWLGVLWLVWRGLAKAGRGLARAMYEGETGFKPYKGPPLGGYNRRGWGR